MKKLVLLVISLLLIGCAGGPKAPQEQDVQAKKFIVPTDNTANLYIYRNESFGGAINMDILIDNVRIATTGPDTYIMANLEAGKHKVEGIAAEGTSILNVDLQPNTNKFVWQEVKMGVFAARNLLKEVSEKEGKAGVLESKLLQHEQLPHSKKQLQANTELYKAENAFVTNSISKPSANYLDNEPVKRSSLKSSRKNSTKLKSRYGSKCDCGSGNYCYGPRGGRYCFSSSGNKRYE